MPPSLPPRYPPPRVPSVRAAECHVADAYASRPRSDAIRLTRRLCQGSETRNADSIPRSFIHAAAASRLSSVVEPTGDATTASAGTPSSTNHATPPSPPAPRPSRVAQPPPPPPPRPGGPPRPRDPVAPRLSLRGPVAGRAAAEHHD